MKQRKCQRSTKRSTKTNRPHHEEERYMEKWYEEQCQDNVKRHEEHSDRECKVVYEPTVHCTEEKEFHHCVKHIVPVVCKQIENHHYDHDYVIEKKYVKEERRFDHGKRKEDWCKVAGCGNCKKVEDFDDDDDCF